MTFPTLGYNKDLFVLPFDHRGSFERGLLGHNPETTKETEHLKAYKRVIYDGFLRASEQSVPLDKSAILVDQQYGSEILADARRRGVVTCVTVEKSGQDEFDFEYGDRFGDYLKQAAPTFAKVLVRYNPDGDARVNESQRRRLRTLSDYARAEGFKFMFELLIPATGRQLDSVGGDTRQYDVKLRPGLVVRAIHELHEAGVEPDVWKLEGVEDAKSARSIVAACRADGRGNVGLIVLGRGENERRVRQWLSVGAKTEGFIGFAVGRTVFWGPLVDFKDGRISRDEAVSHIADNYRGFYELFTQARAQAGARR